MSAVGGQLSENKARTIALLQNAIRTINVAAKAAVSTNAHTPWRGSLLCPDRGTSP
jgi:hypothetical protein